MLSECSTSMRFSLCQRNMYWTKYAKRGYSLSNQESTKETLQTRAAIWKMDACTSRGRILNWKKPKWGVLGVEGASGVTRQLEAEATCREERRLVTIFRFQHGKRKTYPTPKVTCNSTKTHTNRKIFKLIENQ